MKIVGIVAQDFANAGWHIFQALQKYGMDARLINLKKRSGPFPNYESYYDVKYWIESKLASDLIAQADIYHIFESGKAINLLKKLKLKDRPRILSLNAGRWHNQRGQPQKMYERDIKPRYDLVTALTANMPLDETVVLGLQPLPGNEYKIRQDYSLRGTELTVGSAPGRKLSIKLKKHDFLKKKIKNYDMIINLRQRALKARIQKKHDIFTHGLGTGGSYGYSMLQAAMFGVPCFAHLVEGNVDTLLVDDVLPILRVGQRAEKLEEVLELLSEEKNRRKYGQLCARWARKYHGYKACYRTYRGFYETLLGGKNE